MPRKATQMQDNEQQQQAVSRQPRRDAGQQVPAAIPRSCEKDSVVGAEYLTRTDPDEAMIRFEQKPSQAVLGFLKENGFRWSRTDQAWTRRFRSKAGAQTSDAGRRDYGKVVDILRVEKGLPPAQHQNLALQL
jgi:hypothetical protein